MQLHCKELQHHSKKDAHLIKNQDLGLFEESPCHAKQLPLTRAEVRAAFIDARLQASLQKERGGSWNVEQPVWRLGCLPATDYDSAYNIP